MNQLSDTYRVEMNKAMQGFFRGIIQWLLVATLIILAGCLYSRLMDGDWFKQSVAIAASIFFTAGSLASDYRNPGVSLRFYGSVLLSGGIFCFLMAIFHQNGSLNSAIYYVDLILAAAGFIAIFAAVVLRRNQDNQDELLKCIGTLSTVAGFVVSFFLGKWVSG